MSKWLLGRDAIQARSHVIYNILAVLNLIDRVMGNPYVTPRLEYFELVLKELPDRLLSTARLASSETVCAADARAQVNASDIAGVRDSRNEDVIFRVALVSSHATQGAADDARKLQSAILGSRLSDSKDDEDDEEPFP